MMKRFTFLMLGMLFVLVSFAAEGKERMPKLLSFPQMQKQLTAKTPLRKNAAKKVRRKADAAPFVKVNVAPEDWEGTYLIVYEDGNVAMNGGLADKLDAASNSIDIAVSDGEIENTQATLAASFTITAVEGGYAMQSASGLYMGHTATDGNGLLSSTETQYVNQLAIDAEGNADIVGEGGSHLRYNTAQNQMRFRYYKAATYANQKAIQLYKLGGEKTEPEGKGELVALPEGLETESYAMTALGYVSGDQDWETETMNRTVQVAISGTDVYISGLSYWVEEAWVKGTLSGNQVLIPSKSYMGEDSYGYENYIMTYKNDDTNEEGFVDSEYMVLDYDAETRVMTLSEDYFFAESGDATGAEWYDYWYQLTLSPGEAVQPEVVVLPDGLTPAQYSLTAISRNGEENTEVASVAYVAFDGTDVYIQGLCAYLTDAWVKGTKDGNQIVVPFGQYYGLYQSLFEAYELYFMGYSDNGICDVTFTVSEDASTLTADCMVLTNGNALTVEPYEILSEVVLVKAVEKAVMPAAPSIAGFQDWDEQYQYGMVDLDIPIVDVNGDPLVVDKLSYKVYIDESGTVSPYTFTAALYQNLEEDLVEVPFTFDDNYDFAHDGTVVYLSLNSETRTYTRIGVQSIYRGGGVENVTEITWYTISREYDAVRGVAAEPMADGTIYNLAGQRVSRIVKGGIYIQNGKKFMVK